MSDFRIQVDTIVNKDESGRPSFPLGVYTNDSLIADSSSNVTVTGIVTVPHLSVPSVQATNLTSTEFYGDGSALSGLPSITMSKAYALKCIISDPPLRS